MAEDKDSVTLGEGLADVLKSKKQSKLDEQGVEQAAKSLKASLLAKLRPAAKKPKLTTKEEPKARKASTQQDTTKRAVPTHLKRQDSTSEAEPGRHTPLDRAKAKDSLAERAASPVPAGLIKQTYESDTPPASSQRDDGVRGRTGLQKGHGRSALEERAASPAHNLIKHVDEEQDTPPASPQAFKAGDDKQKQTQKQKQKQKQKQVDQDISRDTESGQATQSASTQPPHVAKAAARPRVIYRPAEKGCRSIDMYERLNRIDEGTFGVVHRVRDDITKEVYAVKRLKLEKEREGFPVTALREINTLLKVKHENVVGVREIAIGASMNDIFIVMEFVEHDVKALLEVIKQPLLQAEVKTLMLQLLRGVDHLHNHWIVHRDLKTSNLLLSNQGVLKIADFGLAREYGSPIQAYTQLVVTLWYRAPELLLGETKYRSAIDMWSVGCIFAELVTRDPLMPGRGEIDQLNKMFKLLGVPSEKTWPGFDDLPNVKKVNFHGPKRSSLREKFGNILPSDGLDLMEGMLTYDPAKRTTASEALNDVWFRSKPRPVPTELFPSWPSKAAGQRRRHDSPSAPKGHVDSDVEELKQLMENGGPQRDFKLKF